MVQKYALNYDYNSVQEKRTSQGIKNLLTTFKSENMCFNLCSLKQAELRGNEKSEDSVVEVNYTFFNLYWICIDF